MRLYDLNMDLLNNKMGFIFVLIVVTFEYFYSRYKKLDNFSHYELFSSFFFISLDKIIVYLTNPTDKVPGFLFKIQLHHIDWAPSLKWPVLLLLCDFCYYWSHRYNHVTSLGWASHIMHHSPTKFNCSVSYRVGLTRFFSLSWICFVPLIVMGFNPIDVYFSMGLILVFQFFNHSELIPQLGFLDYIINTPSAHRVHHGTEERLYNSNYGGVTLIFDHLFGTFAKEPKEGMKKFGIYPLMKKHSLWSETVCYWKTIVSDLTKVRTPKQAFLSLFGKPRKISF
jgi:sterol desaturase/sphingolipid hydroxylase (fatty acid hydroxylase superfamily)